MKESLMWRKQIGDFAVYVVVRILICVVQAMRIETGQQIARAAGVAVLRCAARARHRGGRQSGHAFLELSAAERLRLARQMWEHLFVMVIEMAHTPRKIHETNWRDFVRLTNEDGADAATGRRTGRR